MGMNEQQWDLMIDVVQAPRAPREQTERLFRMMQEAISNQLVIRAKRLLVSEELLGEARAQAAALKQKAEADIAQERKKAVNEVKDEIGGMAMEIASKVVEREIKEADHQDLIDEFIKNVGEAS